MIANRRFHELVTKKLKSTTQGQRSFTFFQEWVLKFGKEEGVVYFGNAISMKMNLNWWANKR
jgi:hypothetical protein